MEALAYSYFYNTHEEQEGIEYEFLSEILSWKQLPSSAWLGFLSAIVLSGILSSAKPATAALYVSTPNGSCLNARRQPNMNPQYIYTCVRNGALLKNPVAYQGNWIQLSSGNWVYGPYTRNTGSTRGKQVALKFGTKGDRVRNVQAKLKSLGYVSLGTVDGMYGARTQTAVMNFQKNRGLKVDGIAGTATLRALGV
jgi:hypothetical protein